MATQELNLNDIAAQKYKLQRQMAVLQAQESEMRGKAILTAHADLLVLLEKHRKDFTAKQKQEISSALSAGRTPKTARPTSAAAQAKYQLPHTGQTWSGRGRMPKSFAAWQATVAYTEWKAQHPGLKFPSCPR